MTTRPSRWMRFPGWGRCALIGAACVLIFVATVRGQGIPMSPDFLPLEVGNMWGYAVEDQGGGVTDLAIEILDHRIVDGLSLYVFSRFPFAPGNSLDDPVGIHFDRQTRQYVYTNGLTQGALFPASGRGASVVETDDAGLPLVVELDYGDRTIRIERGVGVTGGSLTIAGGRSTFRLRGARVGGTGVVGDPSPRGLPPLDVAEPVSNVVLPSDTAPVIRLESVAIPAGHRFTLRVTNPTDKLMPFDFASSQDFDFVVTDRMTGQEVWRWARRMFFSAVIRTESLRPNGEWVFEADWSHRNDDLDEVGPGEYVVRGVLTSNMPFESDAVAVRIE